MTIRDDPPADNGALRAALYAGDIFRLPPRGAARAAVAAALSAIEAELGPDYRHAQFRLGPEEFFAAVGRLRRRLYTSPVYHGLLRAILAEAGFDLSRTAFDPFKLRAVPHLGHENPRAAAAYTAHRDTWYAVPRAVLNCWLALHDASEEETFVFYPDCFARPVGNDSEGFDYDEWASRGLRVGWQDAKDGVSQHYPGPVGELRPGTVVSFAAKQAEIVLFAGAHFHQTLENSTGRTRFSIDFRSVHLDDHAAGRGAPDVDNRSTGSALDDYVRPATSDATA